MSAGAPWSVKGIDPKAREVAKDLARRSGMTLGEWLNRVILEDDLPEEVTSESHVPQAPQRGFSEPRLVSSYAPRGGDDLSRIAYALDRLTDRIEASETRTGLAINGVEHSVRQAMARIEAGEREHLAVATRLEGSVDLVSTEQARLAERLRRMETEPAGPRSTEALRAIEQSVTRVANDVYEGEARTREALAQLGARLGQAEARTAQAMESLQGSLGALDARLRSVEAGGADQRLQDLATELAAQVEAARSHVAATLQSTDGGRVDQRLDELAAQVEAAEQRSARAIQQMGREVLGMAEALNRRLQTSEQRSAEAIAQVGGEMARIAGAVETRLGRAEAVQAEALEKLGAEIGRITERLTDRMLASERRAAQAIDDVGEQVARVTERLEQRHERASEDMAVRLRESEERTVRLLEETRERLEQRLREGSSRAADLPPPPTAAFGPELFSRVETEDDAPEPEPKRASFEADVQQATSEFAPIPEPEEDLFGLDQPEPPAAEPEGAKPLSTREVIEQARAAARASAPSGERRVQARAKATWRTTGKPQPGLFGGLKPRTNSTLQTALMVAGVAAFMSVGAAGVVLIEGPRTLQSAEDAALDSVHASPRAAVALTPGAAAPAPPPSSAPAEPAAPAVNDALFESYAKAARGVERGEPGSLAKLKALADAGHTPAQAHLAQLYEKGDRGVVRNLPEARRWMTRAAEGGDAAAMHNLALYLFSGEGGPQDLPGAVRWFRQAAERGVVASQFNLALLYQAGSGVRQDVAEAYKWFMIAAQAGDAKAMSSATELRAKVPPHQLAALDQAARAFPNSGPAVPRRPSMQVAEAQRILGRLGYYKGPADGAADAKLKVALAAYQRDHGLAATGSLDPNTVSRLSVFTR
jgi:localization factor PodJL